MGKFLQGLMVVLMLLTSREGLGRKPPPGKQTEVVSLSLKGGVLRMSDIGFESFQIKNEKILKIERERKKRLIHLIPMSRGTTTVKFTVLLKGNRKKIKGEWIVRVH